MAVLILGEAVWVKVWYNVVAATVKVWLTARVVWADAIAIADASLATRVFVHSTNYRSWKSS